MRVDVSKFGKILISRPSGRDAYLAAKAYILPKKTDTLEFDFGDVKVLSPSWISEFVSLLKKDYPHTKTIFLPSNNPSVNQSLKML